MSAHPHSHPQHSFHPTMDGRGVFLGSDPLCAYEPRGMEAVV